MRTEQLVRQAAGRSDVKVRLFDARPWDVVAAVADRFHEGRAFLVGDAAHAIPPTGGFGGNTGIHDAHNLAWKLAFVLKHGAQPALLDSYDAERRHAAERTLAQALARLASWFKDPTKRLPPVEPIVDDFAVIFGQLYPNGAVVPEGNVGNDEFEDPRQPSGRPGSRAAHFMLDADGGRLAVHDLFNREVVRGRVRWRAHGLTRQGRCARGASCPCPGPHRRRKTTERCMRSSPADGVNPDGAVLVRPDGVIAWRAKEAAADPQTELRRVLARLGLVVSRP